MEETLKILVVDDDEVDRMAVRRSLKNAGIGLELTEATNCESAIAAFKLQPNFDCAFLDYRLPDGDGLTLVREIRASGIKVPLVVLTGQGDEQTAVDLMKAGASDYISKSKVSPESLSRSLRNAVRLYRAEMQAKQAQEQLKESEERYRLVVEGSNDCIWDWDIQTNHIYWNDRFYQITGLSGNDRPDTYKAFFELLHPDDRPFVRAALVAHLEHNEEFDIEVRLAYVSGEYRYCICRGKAQRDAHGKPFRMAGIISDITERKRAEEQQRFLAEASTLLAASLDYEKTLERLARLAVPYISDLCLVYALEADGSLRRMGVSHSDRVQEELVQQLVRRYPLDTNSQHPAIQVLRTGQSDLCSEISDDLLKSITTNAEHCNILRQMDLKSYMIVPLVVSGRTFGAISFVSTRWGHRYGPADLALVEDLARRASLAIENAKAHREAQEASDNLRKAIIILGEQQQQLRTLQQLTNLLNQRLTDLPSLLRVMVGAVCEALAGAQFSSIVLQNPQCNGLVLTVTAGKGTEKLRLEDTFSAQDGWLSRVFATGESQLIQCREKLEATYELTENGELVGTGLAGGADFQSLSTEPNLPVQSDDLLEEKDGHCVTASGSLTPQNHPMPALLYAVPIESAQSGRLGVLAIGNWDNPDAFDEEDKHLLAAVGEQAAIAIDNARLIKTLEEREERLAFQNQMLAEQNQELENLTRRIQLQNLQLLEAARLKSRFLATMSHELRTPMNAVLGFSQLLLRQRQNKLLPKQEEMVQCILNNGKHLLALINDILDHSKMEAGRLELQLAEFNLEILIRTTTEELRSLADEKHLELHVDVNLQNPYVVNDSERLRQVLVNLLSNAIKFTEVGSVWMKVWEESPEKIVFTVKDTGIGIAPEHLRHIFEEFRQVDQNLTKRHYGTGLGLAITESLLELMHGQITVESQLTEGSTFRVEFPRKLSSSNF